MDATTTEPKSCWLVETVYSIDKLMLWHLPCSRLRQLSRFFFGFVMSHGFPLIASLTFSDRTINIMSTATRLGVFILPCVCHVIGTCMIVLFRLYWVPLNSRFTCCLRSSGATIEQKDVAARSQSRQCCVGCRCSYD